MLALALASSLSACGRKGALEPPPGQDYVTTPSGKKVDPGPVRPNRPFLLDPLLN